MSVKAPFDRHWHARGVCAISTSEHSLADFGVNTLGTRKKLTRAEQTALAKIRWQNIGRLLVLSFRRFEEIMVERMRFHGFTDIRQVHTSLLRNIDSDGTRLTEIARRAGMHKQAIGQLAAEFETLGYIRRTEDPTDGRASLVKFTTKGRALLEALPLIHKETHDQLVEIIGIDGISRLIELLSPIAEQQHEREEAALAGADRKIVAPRELSARGRRRGRKPRNPRVVRSAEAPIAEGFHDLER
jgi:DNA-binding MarR family transcriptional regulator